MIVAGGVYREECVRPSWSRIFGSGGRAAAAISMLSPGSRLIAYASAQWADDVRHSMAAFGVDTDLREIEEDIAFHYLHPLSDTELTGAPASPYDPLLAEGDVVLRFGLVEGDVVVRAQRAIYDPQNAEEVLRFHENGSTAKALAIVLNEAELKLGVGERGEVGARELMRRCGAEVLVVKRGPRGAQVVDSANAWDIPAYGAQSIFKIGSGDVFSAIFAQLWGEQRLSPQSAADTASRAVARYVETRNAQVDLSLLSAAVALPIGTIDKRIYLAAPFFTLSQRWLVEEMRRCLSILGASTFSPIHEVGAQGGSVFIASGDLAGLESCGAVLAVIDGEDAGTLFEVGYARKLGIPVVALAESPKPESLTMLEGTGCKVVADFSTAIYSAMWEAAR
jgi:nucleoside 2-deoxyribosyltransferase